MWQTTMTRLILYLCIFKKATGDLQEKFKEMNIEFAINFYQMLKETKNNSNVIISPAGISVSMGLLQIGAKRNTFSQLEDVLGYNINDHRVLDYLQKMYDGLNNSSQAGILQLLSAVFIHRDAVISPAFVQQLSSWANSSLQRTDFSQPDQTHRQINQWVKSHTGGEVTDVISCEHIGSALAQIAIVSALHFKSTWRKQFSFTNTQNLPFITADGSTIKVPMMYQAAEVNFGQFKTPAEQRLTVLELPFLANEVSLFLVLPTDRKISLALIEPCITARAISQWTSGLSKIKLDVFLPRFIIKNKFNLKTALFALGIKDLFDPNKADFGGISEQDSLYVSEAIHEAEIEITEHGTKASSATAMVLLKRSRAPLFKADRPFFFLLRHASTGSILFIGRVQNPVESRL
ncbi:probable serpin E3 [Polypterus senegalus]|uniref:probable serpin E3 n=1 Tax=Polypterus senegalus TaxID=55291 RepID=UPI00196251C0|nr:probable serpin E3 [Polypterus senegalus]